MALATDSNRPQPLRQPPPTACLTASEAPSLLLHPPRHHVTPKPWHALHPHRPSLHEHRAECGPAPARPLHLRPPPSAPQDSPFVGQALAAIDLPEVRGLLTFLEHEIEATAEALLRACVARLTRLLISAAEHERVLAEHAARAKGLAAAAEAEVARATGDAEAADVADVMALARDGVDEGSWRVESACRRAVRQALGTIVSLDLMPSLEQELQSGAPHDKRRGGLSGGGSTGSTGGGRRRRRRRRG